MKDKYRDDRIDGVAASFLRKIPPLPIQYYPILIFLTIFSLISTFLLFNSWTKEEQSLTQKLQITEEDKSKIEEVVDSLKVFSDTLQLSNDSLSRQILENISHLDSLDDKNSELEQLSNNLSARINRYKRNERRFRVEIDYLKKSVADQEGINLRLNNEIMILEEENKNHRETEVLLRKEVDSLKKRIARLEKKKNKKNPPE